MAVQCGRDPSLNGIIQKGNICHTCGKGGAGVELNSDNSCQSCVLVNGNQTCIFCPIVLLPKVACEVPGIDFATLKHIYGNLKCSEKCDSSEMFIDQKGWEQHIVNCVHALTDVQSLCHNNGAVEPTNRSNINMSTRSTGSMVKNLKQTKEKGVLIQCACKLLLADITSFYNHREDCIGKTEELSLLQKKTTNVYKCKCTAEFVCMKQVFRHMEMCSGPLHVVSDNGITETQRNEVNYATKADPDEVMIKEEEDYFEVDDDDQLSFEPNFSETPNDRMKRSTQIFDAKTNAPLLPAGNTNFSIMRDILSKKPSHLAAIEDMDESSTFSQVARKSTSGQPLLTQDAALVKNSTPSKYKTTHPQKKTINSNSSVRRLREIRPMPSEAISQLATDKPLIKDPGVKMAMCDTVTPTSLSSPTSLSHNLCDENIVNEKKRNDKDKSRYRYRCECGLSFARIATLEHHQRHMCKKLGVDDDSQNNGNVALTGNDYAKDPNYDHSTDTEDSDESIEIDQADNVRDDPDFQVSDRAKKRSQGSPNKVQVGNKKTRLDDAITVDDSLDSNENDILDTVNTARSVTLHDLKLINQRESANIKWIECRFCNRKFTEPHHVLSHEGRCGPLHGKIGDTVFCCHCSKTRVYSTPRALAEHEKDCWIFRNVAVLDYNATPLQLKCMLCMAVFNDVLAHKHWANCKMRTKHSQDDKMYPCKFCGYIYYNPLCLGHHQMQCKEENLFGGDDINQSSREQCALCERTFFKQQLKKHMKRCAIKQIVGKDQTKTLNVQTKMILSEGGNSKNVAALLVKGNINDPITLQVPKTGPLTYDTVKVLNSASLKIKQLNEGRGSEKVPPVVNNVSSSSLGQQSTYSNARSRILLTIPTQDKLEILNKKIKERNTQQEVNQDSKSDVEIIEGGLHLCTGCGKSFSKETFLEHQKSCAIPTLMMVECRLCMKMFTPPKGNAYNKLCTSCSLDSEILVICTRCGDAFPSDKQLHEHEVLCLKEPTYECFLCESLFPSPKHLEEHTLKCSTNHMKCQVCQLPLTNAYQWVNHEHDCTFKVTCMYCNQSFISRETAKKHLDICDCKPLPTTKPKMQITSNAEGTNRLKFVSGRQYKACDSPKCKTTHYVKTTEAKLLPNIDTCLCCFGKNEPCFYCGNNVPQGNYPNRKSDGSLGLKCVNCYFVQPYSKVRKHHCTCLKNLTMKLCRGCGVSHSDDRSFKLHELECQSKLYGDLHTCYGCFEVFEFKCDLSYHSFQCQRDKSLICDHCHAHFRNKRFRVVHERLCFANKSTEDEKMTESEERYIHIGEFALGEKIPQKFCKVLSEKDGKKFYADFKKSSPLQYKKCFGTTQQDDQDDFEANLKALEEAVQNVDEKMVQSNISKEFTPLNKFQITDESTINVKIKSVDTISIKDKPISTVSIKDEPIASGSIKDKIFATAIIKDEPTDSVFIKDEQNDTPSANDKPTYTDEAGNVAYKNDAVDPDGKILCHISTPYSLKDVEDDFLNQGLDVLKEDDAEMQDSVQTDDSDPKGHITTDNSRNLFQKCPCCLIAFTSEESIVRHWLRDCVRYNKFFCKICGAGSRGADKVYWTTHRLVCKFRRNKKYCVHCGIVYEDEKQHALAHSQKLYNCQHCGKWCYTNYGLKFHQQWCLNSVTRPICTLCDMVFQNDAGFVAHNQPNNNSTKNSCTIKTQRAKLALENRYCMMTLIETHQDGCKLNPNNSQSKAKDASVTVLPSDTTDKHYVCKICRISFCNNADAVKHNTDCHLYVCPVCQRFYTKPKLFLQHREMHLKNKVLYVCNMCKVCLNNPEEMQEHAALEHPLLSTIACSILKDNKTDANAIRLNIKEWHKVHNKALLDGILESKNSSGTKKGSLAWNIQHRLTETHNQVVHQIFSDGSLGVVRRLQEQLKKISKSSEKCQFNPQLIKLMQLIENILYTLKHAIELRLPRYVERSADVAMRKSLKIHYVELIRFFESQNIRVEGIPLFHGNTLDAMKSLEKAAKESADYIPIKPNDLNEDQVSENSSKTLRVIKPKATMFQSAETMASSKALVSTKTTSTIQKSVAPLITTSVAPSATQVTNQIQMPLSVTQVGSTTQAGGNVILVPVAGLNTIPNQPQSFVAVPVQQCHPGVPSQSVPLPHSEDQSGNLPLQLSMLQSTGSSQAPSLVQILPQTSSSKSAPRMPTLTPKPGLFTPAVKASTTPFNLGISSPDGTKSLVKSEPTEPEENRMESPVGKETPMETETHMDTERPMETDMPVPLPNIPGLNPALLSNPLFSSILKRFHELNENMQEESDQLGIEVQRRLQEASTSSQSGERPPGMSLMNFMSLPSQINFSDDESEKNEEKEDLE